MWKFSVLLPTRNRLHLLKHAIETVRRQDYKDWEIIVSDNCSGDDIGGYVRSLNEPRIHYFRTKRDVPVTENWNNALNRCSGDYVVMLGDDDGLMRGYFSTVRRVIEAHQEPDLVYTSALLYAYPNVIPGHPDGFVQTYGYGMLIDSASEPFWLDPATARDLVRQSMEFKVRFGFNMQFAVMSRRLIDVLRRKGDVFQSPYPDYYAMNAMLLVAERTLVLPKPLVAIGISPKSFGYYYFNDLEQRGVEFLKNLPERDVVERVQHVILPGTNMNTSWLLAMETLLKNYGAEFPLSVRYGRYRLMQLLQVLRSFIVSRASARADLLRMLPLLRTWEKLLFATLLGPFSMLCLPLPHRLRKALAQMPLAALRTYPRFTPCKIPGSFANILDVFEKIDPSDA